MQVNIAVVGQGTANILEAYSGFDKKSIGFMPSKVRPLPCPLALTRICYLCMFTLHWTCPMSSTRQNMLITFLQPEIGCGITTRDCKYLFGPDLHDLLTNDNHPAGQDRAEGDSWGCRQMERHWRPRCRTSGKACLSCTQPQPRLRRMSL